MLQEGDVWHLFSLTHFSLTWGQKKSLKCNVQPIATSLRDGKEEPVLPGTTGSVRMWT